MKTTYELSALHVAIVTAYIGLMLILFALSGCDAAGYNARPNITTCIGSEEYRINMQSPNGSVCLEFTPKGEAKEEAK